MTIQEQIQLYISNPKRSEMEILPQNTSNKSNRQVVVFGRKIWPMENRFQSKYRIGLQTIKYKDEKLENFTKLV